MGARLGGLGNGVKDESGLLVVALAMVWFMVRRTRRLPLT